MFILGSSEDQVTNCTARNKTPDGKRKREPGISSLLLMPNSLVLKIVSAIRIWGEGTFLLFFCFILMVSWTYLSFFLFSQVFVVYFPFMTSVPRLLSISPFSFYPTEWFSTLHSTLALPSEVVWPWPSHTPSRASLFSFVKWNGLVRNFLRFLPALTFSLFWTLSTWKISTLACHVQALFQSLMRVTHTCHSPWDLKSSVEVIPQCSC